jgi:choline dehydrogenase-like flavoprotein
MRIAVIGSGPSGWSTAKTLVRLGHEVTVIDAALDESDTNAYRAKTDQSKLNRKLYFGSDLPYRDFPFGPSIRSKLVNPAYSFAKGGLSLVWGATMLPYCEDDTAGWPLDISMLDHSYHAIAKEIPITGADDGLCSTYGKFYSRRGIFPSNRILRILETAEGTNDPEIQVGLSRLAVETGKAGVGGCIYCHKCISGCPSNFIWNSKDLSLEVKHLKLRVIKLVESDPGVKIEAIDVLGKPYTLETFDKVFLASGSLESFRILATSRIIDDIAILKDSATFFIPMFALPKLGKVLQNSFGLSQLFIRFNKTETHVASQYQLYEYSEDLIVRAQKALPFGGLIPKFILRFFLMRMMVAIGYLDGADSPSIRMRLLDDGSLFSDIAPFAKSSKDRNKVIKLSIKRLSKYTRKCGLVPIPFLTQIAVPGEGVHFGSWMPMGDKSDLLGRPIGSKNIHVVDSSVLPTIAPGPITFTVMANAMRIAEGAVR